jgi:hypothetical protein
MLYRAEWLTAYTPYQPEVSQGTLQSIFEFQTHICLLTGLDVANASLYEGASALAEALLMAERLTRGRTKAVLSKGIHPEYRETVRTYFANLDLEIVEVPVGRDGATDPSALAAAWTRARSPWRSSRPTSTASSKAGRQTRPGRGRSRSPLSPKQPRSLLLRRGTRDRHRVRRGTVARRSHAADRFSVPRLPLRPSAPDSGTAVGETRDAEDARVLPDARDARAASAAKGDVEHLHESGLMALASTSTSAAGRRACEVATQSHGRNI